MKRIIIAAVIAISAILWGATAAIPATEPLQVVNALPQGRIDQYRGGKEITVFFNKSMAVLEAIPSEQYNMFQISPKLPGKFRWKDNKTLQFIPDIPLPNATRFTVTIPTSLRALDGSAMAQSYTWTFETSPPAVTYTFPQDGAVAIDLSPQMTVSFNQAIDPEQAKPYIKLTLKNYPTVKLPIKITADNNFYLKITPVSPLAKNMQYVLTIAGGLPGKEGTMPMEADRTINFMTYGVFRYIGVSNMVDLNPEDALSFQFTNPIDRENDAITKFISIEPKAELKSTWGWDRNISLQYNLKSLTNYKVIIKAGLKDKFGQPLGQDQVITFRTKHRESSVGFKQGLGIIESYLDKKVSIDLVNVQSLDINKASVALEDIIKVYQGYYTYAKWNISSTINTNSSADRKNIFPIDLSDVIKGDTGIAVVSITPHGDNFPYQPGSMLGLYNVTNVGITAKFSPYSGLIWVTRLKDSTPVAGAEVELRSEAIPDKTLWKGVTDADGFVSTPGKVALGIGDNIWALVKHPDGVAFVSSGWDWGIQPYRFGMDEGFVSVPRELEGDIFTDRGLYKPGEEVHIKGIIREKQDKNWMIPRKANKGILDIYEYNEGGDKKSIYTETVTLSDFGSFDRTVRLKNEIPMYNTVYISFVPEGPEPWRSNNIINKSFTVATFRPAQFQVSVHPMQSEYIKGDNIRAGVNGSYLFGAPLGGSEINWTISKTPFYYDPPGHEGYVYGSYYMDYLDSNGSVGDTISGSGNLDKDGNYDIVSNLGTPSSKLTMSAMIEAKVKDTTAQEISGRSSVIVHPGSFYIGLKSRKTFIKENEEYPIDAITVAPNGDMSAGNTVKLSLIKREWKSAKKLTSYGEYVWSSEVVDTPVDEKEVATGAEPVSVTFKPAKAGFYIIKAAAKDKAGNEILTTSYLYVTGLSYTGWDMGGNDDRIELVADKKSYEPGDMAKILVKSPYNEVDALVTVEREGIIDRWMMKLHGSADLIEIPIKSSYLPNVYVSVVLIKGRLGMNMFNEAKQDIGKPAFKMGYVQLPVSPKEKRLTVTVTPAAKVYKPGATATVEVQVNDITGKGVVSEVCIATVDEGVLNLINYNIPDPFGIFYAPRPLSVMTAETRHHIIGQRIYGEKGGEGGGGDDGNYNFLSFPMSESRKDFRYTADWSPAVITNAQGKAVISFTLPDSLTSYRIMAVANTRDSSFGAGKAVIKTSKPLMLTPVMPRFIRVGDTISGGVMVHNYSDKPMMIKLQPYVQGVNISGDTTDSITIPAGEREVVRYNYIAPTLAGSASIGFTATSDTGESDAVKIDIPVVQSNPKETVAFFGYTREAAIEKVRIPDNDGVLSVSMMSTALSGLSGTVEYLFDYPYGCLEQTVSRILPMILFGDTVDSFNLPSVPGGKYRDVVKSTLPKIKSFQKYDGSFGLWENSAYSDPYISAYTVFMLIEARKHGYAIDEAVLNKGLGYLNTLMGQSKIYPYGEYELNTVKAFALYTLSDTGKYEPSYAQYLYERRLSLPFFARAYLLMAIVNGKGSPDMVTELKRELMNGLVYEGGIAHIEESAQYNSYWIFGSDPRSTAAVLMALMKSYQPGASAANPQPANQSVGNKIMNNISKVPFVGKFVKKEEPVQPSPVALTGQTDDTIIISMVRWLSEKAKGGAWRSTQENLFVFWALGEYSRIYEGEKPDFTATVTMGDKANYNAVFKGKNFAVSRKEASLSLFKPNETIDTNIKKSGTGTLFYKLQMDYIPRGVLPPLDEGIRVNKTYYTLDGKPVVNGVFKLGETYKVDVALTVTHDRSYVVLESPLASGFEPVNTSFATESQAAARTVEPSYSEDDMYGWWYSPFSHSLMWDDRIVVFSNYLPVGTYTYSYLIKATIPGRFHIPPDKAEMMYYPEIFGRSGSSDVEVR